MSDLIERLRASKVMWDVPEGQPTDLEKEAADALEAMQIKTQYNFDKRLKLHKRIEQLEAVADAAKEYIYRPEFTNVTSTWVKLHNALQALGGGDDA